jgi:hypothetical protein
MKQNLIDYIGKITFFNPESDKALAGNGIMQLLHPGKKLS